MICDLRFHINDGPGWLTAGGAGRVTTITACQDEEHSGCSAYSNPSCITVTLILIRCIQNEVLINAATFKTKRATSL